MSIEYKSGFIEGLDINSEHINKVVSDSEKFKEWEVQKDREFGNKVNINNEENETLDLRRQERLKYEEAKKIYKKVSNEIKETLKFQEQIDYIIKNISKTKDIKNIEDTFEVEELRQIIELAQKGTHNALEEVVIEEAEKKNKKKI